MPLVQTRGAASAQGFGEFAQASGPAANYIEDVFSTYLYTGNGSTQTITNGIDLSTKGGLVWTKARSAADDSRLFDTSSNSILSSSLTNAKLNGANALVPTYVTFNTNGFYTPNDFGGWNTNGTTYASWTFREQEKFFDVVTWTGDGVAGRTIAHNLGSVPGCIIVKCTSASSIWSVYHRSEGATKVGILDGTNAFATSSAYWNNTAPTSSVFTVGAASAVNDSGQTFVAYIFAHDAGGFGLTGSDNVISCGSYTGNGSTIGPTVTLGYEPQWIMIKKSSAISGSESWAIWDNMRSGGLWDDWLIANGSQAEQVNNANVAVQITSTGFFPNATNNTANSYVNTSGSTYVYIAIRRGPMKVPTVGTSVFSPIQATTGTQTTNFPIDLQIGTANNTTDDRQFSDRLRGFNSPNGVANQPYLKGNSTAAELTNASFSRAWDNTGFLVPPYYDGLPAIYWSFRRAPSFFDELCYTGDATATRTLTHNLTVTPELIIVRKRNSGGYWNTFFNFGSTNCSKMTLDDASAAGLSDYTGNFSKMGGAPTSTSFFVTNPAFGELNDSGTTYVTYLFATCAGVSKVGSYTGNGTTQTINCGFGAGGARFVLIKRTDASGDWYIYDTARGMTVLTDPYVIVNSTAAQTATLGSVTTVSTGFALNSSILAAINISAGSYIFLAIA